MNVDGIKVVQPACKIGIGMLHEINNVRVELDSINLAGIMIKGLQYICPTACTKNQNTGCIQQMVRQRRR